MKRTIGPTITIAACWLLYFAAATPISRFTANSAGEGIMEFVGARSVPVLAFVQHRLFEAVWLVTLFLFCLVAMSAASQWQWRRGTRSHWRWSTQSILFLFCGSAWLWAAGHTLLFWGLTCEGKSTPQLAHFHINLVLAQEDRGTHQAVLMGSSQSHYQIDESVLNQALAPSLVTTDLHYPSSKAYDLLLVQPSVSRARPDYVICYLTEAYFHGGAGTEVQPNFLGISDLYPLARQEGFRFVPKENVVAGALGSLFPLFRLRDVISQRLYGPDTVRLKQREYDAALETDLKQRAERIARDYHVDEETSFQEKAFEDFVVRCHSSRQHLVILVGQMNPLFTQLEDPKVREEMFLFLHRLISQHPGDITLVENLPQQTEADYEDISHATPAARQRFSIYLVEWLRTYLSKPTVS